MTNKVLCILAFASMFYAGFISGEKRVENKVYFLCKHKEFVEIFGYGINCSVRTRTYGYVIKPPIEGK